MNVIYSKTVYFVDEDNTLKLKSTKTIWFIGFKITGKLYFTTICFSNIK